MDDLTRILADVAEGRPEASERLVALLYGELRAMARREMAGERAGHTLQPTALVHEAYLRLAGFAPELARVVELRFFAGMTIPETARLLDRSETTVQRDWRLARAWLRGELGAQAADGQAGGERDGP